MVQFEKLIWRTLTSSKISPYVRHPRLRHFLPKNRFFFIFWLRMTQFEKKSHKKWNLRTFDFFLLGVLYFSYFRPKHRKVKFEDFRLISLSCMVLLKDEFHLFFHIFASFAFCSPSVVRIWSWAQCDEHVTISHFKFFWNAGSIHDISSRIACHRISAGLGGVGPAGLG